ncbi:TPA: hypothetical protein ACQUJH_001159 [Neisseria cinerea]
MAQPRTRLVEMHYDLLVLLEGGTHLGLYGNAEYVRTLADFFSRHSQ